MSEWDNKKKKIFWVIVLVIALAGFLFFQFGGMDRIDKKAVVVNSLNIFEKVVKFLPIKEDTKKEIETVDRLVEEFTKKDGQSRKYLLLLQNNMELRPGGGFLGQYSVVEVKDGEITSLFFEDANLLDQRITAKIATPYPFERMMSIKKWKFRDSNFSPDYPRNVEKAKYFYRLADRSSGFDGVIAINASVLNRILELTGPITVPGYSGEYNSENAVLKLEEQVERVYLVNPELDTQNRKAIMKKMAPIIVDKLFKIGNIKKLADFSLEEMRNKDIQLNFENQGLQSLVEQVGWGGQVDESWDGDYLMFVDANMGALKSDYFMKRDINYVVDLTSEKPNATIEYTYTHTATYGDWRTSDYHSYLRVYVPNGSELTERKMVSYPNIQEDFGKTYFGFIAHTLINDQTKAIIKYDLPDHIRDDYKLMVQKQSGVGDVPIKILVKTADGEFRYEGVLKKDLVLEFDK
ncbi:MAG: DUF4012 domain-containing protein [Patescibacteria group bacterium]|nr:DUF4012 domain-containing protein [Patescibacteria group bacterium]